jgi:nitrite reductase (NO-forming)
VSIVLALTIIIFALVVISSFSFAFQPSVFSASNNDQVNISTTESLTPTMHRSILLIANENVLRIAPDNDIYPGGLWHTAMTFNGTIPGPVIIANQGDTLTITLKNEGKLAHSLNFHAGFGPSHALSGVVSAGENTTWTMKVNYAGAFLYQCDGDNLNGMWEHIADGMYGGIVVRSPDEELNTAHEFYVAFSEIYDTHADPPFTSASQSPVGGDNNITSNSNNNQTVTGSFDIQQFIDRKPDLILTNGMAFRYISWIGTESKIILNADAEAFHVRAGELTRWYIFNAGPRNSISFNFGAGLVKEVIENNESNSISNYVGNNGSNGRLATAPSLLPSSDRQSSQGYYDEVVNIPPGSGTIIEATFPEPGEYFGNDHDVGNILYGAGFVVIAE